MDKDIDIAKSYLTGCGYSLVVVKGCVELVSYKRGILPLLMIYDECPSKLDGASLADKVIGKAAAFILAETGIKEVYGQVMCEAAVAVLERKGIKYGYGRLVPGILDREGKGPCPIDKLCSGIDDPLDGIMAITVFICRNKDEIGKKGAGEKPDCRCT